jgi:2-keto-4-pentenoate hydratase/2-oxohepta-3-ene-1,7-dioic acid hydratase in catechol pathway
VGGEVLYGTVQTDGFCALSAEFPQFATLRDVIAAEALPELALASAGRAATHTEWTYEIPVPNPEKIICVGVNFPDRNAEYKDGQEAPPNMSLFPRVNAEVKFPRSAEVIFPTFGIW